MFRASKLWNILGSTLFSNTENLDLSHFREPENSICNRLASWSPYDSETYRYYKTIMFNLALTMPEKFFDYYKMIGNTAIGNPIQVRVDGVNINWDYMLSVQEIMFCDDILKHIHIIAEIGAGYGRTCHAILKNFDRLIHYVIIDLPPCLKLSQRYLKKVLEPKEFQKVEFIDASCLQKRKGKIDLFINIDSMAEMDIDVAKNYLHFIDQNSSYFYSCNPIGKYQPKMIGLQTFDEKLLNNILSLGLCRDIIDIFDSESLKKARKNYLLAYKPSNRWEMIKSAISLPIQYYHHALFHCS